MSKHYLIGVDIGTQGTKSVIVSVDGKLLGSGLVEYGVEQPRPSWAEQWPQVWETAAYSAIQKSIDGANIEKAKIAGVCVSGLYGGSGIPVDEDFVPLRPCLIWMDRRARNEVKWIKENADLDRMFSITGNYVDTYFGYPKILWIKGNEPRIWGRIHKFIPPSSYFVYKLTGQLAIDYSSAGNLGGIFDINRLSWSEELCELLGIPLEMMPERIVASTDIVGEVTREAADKCGIPAGTPVIAGGIDAPMATLSAGAIEPGDNVAMMGTSTCWGVIHHGESYAKSIVSMPHVVNPAQEVYSWAGSATSGALIRWYKEQFGQAEMEAGRMVGLDPYKLLDMRAEHIPPGAEGLLILPYFMGERTPLWDPTARGTILGLTLYHTKDHLFRALMEAAAYSLCHSIETGEKIGLRLKKQTRVVGGVTKSRLWTRILADVTGREMLIPSGGIGAPLGDALLAGIGVDLIEDHRAIEDWTHMERVVTPDIKANGLYAKYYALYRGLYGDIKDRMHELAAIKGVQDDE